MRTAAQIEERLEALAALLGAALGPRRLATTLDTIDAAPPGPHDRVMVGGDLAALDPAARDHALRAIAARLAPAGIAAVGHAVAPGAGLTHAIYTLLAMRLGDAASDPAARATALAELAARSRAARTPYGEAIALYATRCAADAGAPIGPGALDARAATIATSVADLRILADADPSPEDTPPLAFAKLVPTWFRAPEGATIGIDALAGRAFRTLALVRADAPFARPPKWRTDRVATMAARARPRAASRGEGLIGAALAQLVSAAAADAAAVPFKELLRVARERRSASGGASASSDDTRVLREGLLTAWLRGDIDLIPMP